MPILELPKSSYKNEFLKLYSRDKCLTFIYVKYMYNVILYNIIEDKICS